MLRKLAWGDRSLSLFIFRVSLLFRIQYNFLPISSRADAHDVTLRIVDRSDLDWLQLFLDISVESALCDDFRGQILIKLIDVQIDLEKASVRGADNVTQLLKALVGDC